MKIELKNLKHISVTNHIKGSIIVIIIIKSLFTIETNNNLD